MRLVFVFVILVGISVETSGQLLWNDPASNDIGCVYPQGILFPLYIIPTLLALPQNFKMYATMANKTYYRWMFQKATNAPATSESDLDSLKPIVTFPDFSQFSTLSQGSVSIFDPPTAFYNLLCIPNNLSLTNSTCSVKNASPGSAPQGFGTGDPVASTMIWADATAFMEWHCFEGDRQVFNVISLNKSLTPSQIEAITAVVVSLGFSPDNFATQTYA